MIGDAAAQVRHRAVLGVDEHPRACVRAECLELCDREWFVVRDFGPRSRSGARSAVLSAGAEVVLGARLAELDPEPAELTADGDTDAGLALTAEAAIGWVGMANAQTAPGAVRRAKGARSSAGTVADPPVYLPVTLAQYAARSILIALPRRGSWRSGRSRLSPIRHRSTFARPSASR